MLEFGVCSVPRCLLAPRGRKLSKRSQNSKRLGATFFFFFLLAINFVPFCSSQSVGKGGSYCSALHSWLLAGLPGAGRNPAAPGPRLTQQPSQPNHSSQQGSSVRPALTSLLHLHPSQQVLQFVELLDFSLSCQQGPKMLQRSPPPLKGQMPLGTP